MIGRKQEQERLEAAFQKQAMAKQLNHFHVSLLRESISITKGGKS